MPGLYYDKIWFEELAEDLLMDYRVNRKKSFVRAEGSIRLHLRPFFGGMKVMNITTGRIKKYINKRQEDRAKNATINRELAALKRMFNLAAQSTPSKVAKIPHFPMLAENNVRKGFFEHGEFLALRDRLPEHLKGFVTFGYKSGWRLSEISDLVWERVDMEQGIARLDVGETKNDEGRTFYMDEELRGIMKKHFANRHLGCPYVFHRDGNRVKEFRKSWARACKEAGIGKKLFHDFRRTAVRNMVRAGIPERVAMTISGHKTRSVFDRYNIVNADDLKQASLKMESYFRRNGAERGQNHRSHS